MPSSIFPLAGAGTGKLDARAGLTLAGLVDGQRSPIEFMAIETAHGYASFFGRVHFHEGEPPGSARNLVDDQGTANDRTDFLEQIAQVLFRGVKRQVSDE